MSLLLDYDKLFFGFKLRRKKRYIDKEIISLKIQSKISWLMKNLSTIIELCQSLTRTNKLKTFYFFGRLIHFILTLHVSFSTM